MSKVAITAAKLAVAVLFAAQAGACASIIRGDSENFTIQSSPPEASVETSLGVKCTTPCTFKAKRKDRFAVTVTKPGYQEQRVLVRRKLGKGGIGAGIVTNVIVVGAIGVGVDFATGAVYDLEPNPLVVTLVPEGAPAPTPVAPAVVPATPVSTAPAATAAPVTAPPATAQ